MTLEKLRRLLASEPAYRLNQAARAIFDRGAASFEEIQELPVALRAKLRDIPVLCMTPEAIRVSKDGSAHKALMRLEDGKRIETVLMSPKPGLWSVCVSCQVGCALGCSFCATGRAGFIRDLTVEEITDQVLFWRQYARGCAAKAPGSAGPPGGCHASNVVYMGMGEPMLNLTNVLESIKRLSSPDEFNIGQRHLSVSTVGILPGMARFSKAFPQVNLAVSLHAADPDLRTRLVPINKTYSLDRLAQSLRDYFGSIRRKVFIEYALIRGENDRREHAQALARFLQTMGFRHLLHVNLIVLNPTSALHKPSRIEDVNRFLQILRQAGVSVSLRKNLGQDIEAACGQLAGRKPFSSRPVPATHQGAGAGRKPFSSRPVPATHQGAGAGRKSFSSRAVPRAKHEKII